MPIRLAWSARVRRAGACLLLLPVGFGAPLRAAGPVDERPRLFVLTDISNEPDDEESLVRLLVYSNEFEIEGLVATTSVWLRDKVRPDLLARDVDAYALVRPNLVLHAEGFPPADLLRARIGAGLPLSGLAGVGEGKSNQGSEAIIRAVDRPDPRPLWVTVWGGPVCLAQALWEVEHTRSPEAVEAFVGKLRVYTISDQDDSGPWIRRRFPRLNYIVSPSTVNGDEYYTATWTGISGDRHYRNGPRVHFDLVDNPWLTAHIIAGHGPLGALYPPLAYIMEGDTPSFLNLIGNGLAADRSPDWGGWGGRYALRQSYGESRPIWTNSRDTVRLPSGGEETSAPATIWRWREAFQNDFAARMDWCVRPRAGANHNPRLVVNGIPGRGPVPIAARPGDRVALSAAGSSDPDGDELSYHWFHYPEAGSPRRVRSPLAIAGDQAADAVFVVPPEAAHETFHLVLEVVDHGSPRLFSYRRVIVQVP